MARVPGFDGRAALRTWLYRIATNTCLNAIRTVRRRPARAWDIPGVDAPPPTSIGETAWLQPYPDALLAGVRDGDVGPEARYERTESIALTFIAALQLLPPRQLAALVLRDVLGFSARDVAAQLGVTTTAVNSLLARARSTLARRTDPARPRPAPPPAGSRAERALAARFAKAYEAADVPALLDLFTDDVYVSMPPLPLEFSGRDAAGEFFARLLGGARRYRLVPTRANGQPAFAAYLVRPDGPATATGLFTVTLSGDRIAATSRFEPSVFGWFGLPQVHPG